MSIELFAQAQQVGQVTGDGVPMLANLFEQIGVCDRDPEFLCSFRQSGRLLTHHRPGEARNLIDQYYWITVSIIDRNGHIDLYWLFQ